MAEALYFIWSCNGLSLIQFPRVLPRGIEILFPRERLLH